MTTVTRNEAQPRDRLLSTIEAYTDREMAKSLAFAVTAAIGQTKAAERRATVERAKAIIAAHGWGHAMPMSHDDWRDGESAYDHIVRHLDEASL